MRSVINFSPYIITVIKSRRLGWPGNVARMGEIRNVYIIVVGISEGKRSLWRPLRTWKDNIKMDRNETQFEVSIHVA
jgi:hypothetical protein